MWGRNFVIGEESIYCELVFFWGYYYKVSFVKGVLEGKLFINNNECKRLRLFVF